MDRVNYYSSEIANSPEVVRRGFETLIQATEKSRVKEAWLVCNTKSNLHGLISEVIGAQAAGSLSKGHPIRLTNGSLLLFHARSMPYSANGNPILACFPDEKLLQRIDDLVGASCLIVLPWSMDDIRPWILARGAVDILGKVHARPSEIANPVVRAALEELLNSINIGTGVIHRSDKDAAIGTFRVLRDAGEVYDPPQVAAWFVQNGMTLEHAARVEAIASSPNSFRGSGGAIRKDKAVLARWRFKAGQKSTE